MFILTDSNTGGIYATTLNSTKVVHIFEQRDDAERYINQLEAIEYEDTLDIMEVERDIVAINCDKYGYKYSIVSKDDLVIPPLD